MTEAQIEEVARIAHEVNRSFCAAIGDHSQVAWEDAPAWQRESAINGVRFHLANPGSTPEAGHENWLREKLETGWTYGPVKNPEKKEHPCCVPYEALPTAQRFKDRLFTDVVAAFLPKPAATHVFEGVPDERQSGSVNEKTSRFRPRYRALTPNEKALHDAIKAEACEMEELIELVPDGRDKALAMTHLEDAVMRAVRAITA